MRALSVTPFAETFLDGPCQRGRGLGHGYVALQRGVLALTRPGGARMPNGIETDVRIEPGELVTLGEGALRSAGGSVTAGPLWNPVPRVVVGLLVEPRITVDESLAGWGPGLTPLGDDLLVGYIAGRVLAGDVARARAIAVAAAPRTTSLSATLLHLAAGGALPEPAHRLLEHGDIEPLLSFGVTSGAGLAVGLALALAPEGDVAFDAYTAIALALPCGRTDFRVGC